MLHYLKEIQILKHGSIEARTFLVYYTGDIHMDQNRTEVYKTERETQMSNTNVGDKWDGMTRLEMN